LVQRSSPHATVAATLPPTRRHGPIEVWIIDDTSFPKQGSHSVGVHHQYCGQLGKQANCQVAVTLSIANHHASLPIAYRLYLPETWAEDAVRRKKTRVPREIEFKTKPQIALEQIRAASAAGVPPGVVLMDASCGSNRALRAGVSALALSYVAAIVIRDSSFSRKLTIVGGGSISVSSRTLWASAIRPSFGRKCSCRWSRASTW
jgi:SRSO17 transposase